MALKPTDYFYRNSVNGAIYRLSDGKHLTPDEWNAERNAHPTGTVVGGSVALPIALVAEYAALHAPAMTNTEAEAAVRARYQTYLKRSPKADEADDVIFWRDALLNLARQHGKDAALAELNLAFTNSEEYKALQRASGGGSSSGGGGLGTGVLGPPDGTPGTGTTAGGGIMDTIAGWPTWVKVGGAIAAAVGLMMVSGGDNRR